MQLLESKIPLCFRFLGHSDDDVSASVMDFAREYVQVICGLINALPGKSELIHTFLNQLLKQKAPINDAERQQVESLLFIIFEKTKYDEGFFFDRDGEEEAIFLEYR